MAVVAETPWNCVVSCCCCFPRSTPPDFSLVAMVCSKPGLHFVEASDLVQLQHLVSKKIQREQRRNDGLREEGKHAPNPPNWPEAVLNCLSEREAGLGVGGTPWVKE